MKVSERYRTTEQVERAFVDEREYSFLYQDGDIYHFMDPANYDQLDVPPEIVGEMSVYLQDGMLVHISTHDGVPISMELPARVTLEDRRDRAGGEGPDPRPAPTSPPCSPTGLRIMIPDLHHGRHQGRGPHRGRFVHGAGEGVGRGASTPAPLEHDRFSMERILS